MVAPGSGVVNNSDRRPVRQWRPGEMRWMENEAMKESDICWEVRGVTEGEEERSDEGMTPLTSWLKRRDGRGRERDRWGGIETEDRTEGGRARRAAATSEEDGMRQTGGGGLKEESANKKTRQPMTVEKNGENKRASHSVCGPGRARPSVIQPGC